LSSGNSSWLVFHVSILFCSRSPLPSEFDWPRKRPLDPHCPRNRELSTGSGKSNWKRIQLLTLPENIGWRSRRERFSKLAANKRPTEAIQRRVCEPGGQN